MDDLTKNTHGVFTVGKKLIETIDDGWDAVKAIPPSRWNSNLPVGSSETVDGITRSLRMVGGQVYESFVIPMGRTIGYQGGSAGTGAALTHLLISVKKGTSEIITAFPI